MVLREVLKSAIRNPKFDLELLAGFEPATSTFEASRSSSCATGAEENFGLRIAEFGFETDAATQA